MIGGLSRRTGVNIETIRYYERIGLMAKVRRAPNGRRLYADSDLRRLAFVRHGRELGFDMPSIRTLLTLQQEPDASCEEITHVAQNQLAAIDYRIKRLRVLRSELSRILKACAGGRVGDCRIVETLSKSTEPRLP